MQRKDKTALTAASQVQLARFGTLIVTAIRIAKHANNKSV